MKRTFIPGLLLAIAGMMTTGCSCQSENKKQETVSSKDYDGVVQDFTAGTSHIQAMHRQKMYAEVSKEYEWRNSKILFNDTIRQNNLDDLHVVDVTDVFQYWNEGPQVQFISTNVKKGTVMPTPVHDVWIEDASLNDCPIKLSCEDVLKRLKEWNGVIPPAVSISLRNPVGPRNCNAQWVVGDVFDVIFVDAVTGEIVNWNPAFPNPSVNGPLGEWP